MPSSKIYGCRCLTSSSTGPVSANDTMQTENTIESANKIKTNRVICPTSQIIAII